MPDLNKEVEPLWWQVSSASSQKTGGLEPGLGIGHQGLMMLSCDGTNANGGNCVHVRQHPLCSLAGMTCTCVVFDSTFQRFLWPTGPFVLCSISYGLKHHECVCATYTVMCCSSEVCNATRPLSSASSGCESNACKHFSCRQHHPQIYLPHMPLPWTCSCSVNSSLLPVSLPLDWCPTCPNKYSIGKEGVKGQRRASGSITA